MEDFSQVNWLAVSVGTVVAFLVGWAWYSPMLFGKKWAAGSGVELGTANDMPAVAMVAQFLGLFLLALVVGITATTNALMTAILAIITTCVFAVAAGGFVKKSGAAMTIDFFYRLVAGIIMIMFQAIF